MSDSAMNEANEPKKKSKMKIIVIALILALLASAFFAYAYFTKSFIFGGEVEELPKVSQIYTLDDFTVNLKDPGSKSYLMAKIAFGVEDEGGLESLATKQMQIRDIIIQTLRAKTKDEIMAVEKTDDLKKELMDNVNEIFEPDIIMDVYLIDFLIQ